MQNSIGLYPAAIIIGTCASLIFFSPNSSAHPGNTASDDGHYCRTNCDYWGYEYDERHFHDEYEEYSEGGYTTRPAFTPPPTYLQQGQTNGRRHADEKNNSYIVETAKTEGADDGLVDAHTTSKPITYSPTNSICDTEFSFNEPRNAEYESSFHQSYSQRCKEIYNQNYSTKYDESYNEAKVAIEAQRLSDIKKRSIIRIAKP